MRCFSNRKRFERIEKNARLDLTNPKDGVYYEPFLVPGRVFGTEVDGKFERFQLKD